MKTIAQQLKVTDFPFSIKDKNGNEIYREDSDGYWVKGEYDSKGNQIYFEDSDGYWGKGEYDSKGNQIYFEDSDGQIRDKRPKQVELTLQEIADKMGIEVEQLRIKK
jgi:hypothetical protein